MKILECFNHKTRSVSQLEPAKSPRWARFHIMTNLNDEGGVQTPSSEQRWSIYTADKFKLVDFLSLTSPMPN
jgi:hypothetical protein